MLELNVFVNLGLGGDYFNLRIAGKIAKIVKIRTRKNFVPHGISSLSELFFCFVDNLSLYLRKTIKNFVPFVGEKLQRI